MRSAQPNLVLLTGAELTTFLMSSHLEVRPYCKEKKPKQNINLCFTLVFTGLCSLRSSNINKLFHNYVFVLCYQSSQTEVAANEPRSLHE